MRRRSLRLAAVLGLAGAFGAGLAAAATVSVGLGPSGPQPATVTVQWGDTVEFSNADGESHGITIPRLTVASPAIASGASWAHVFDGRTGNYIFRQTGTRDFNGAVVVQLTGSVTMTARPATVTFGRPVALRGAALPGFPVKVEQQVPERPGEWSERLVVEAAADGSWSVDIVPEIGSRFRASAAANQLRSPVVLVRVKPRVTLAVPRRARAGRVVTVRARVAPATAAATADLERYDGARRRWVREQRRRVDRAGNVAFRWRVVRGRSLLRVQLLRASVRQGFDPARGAAVSVTGR